MNDEQKELARRLAADSRFNKWTAGLRIVYGTEPHEQYRVDGDGEDAVIISAEADVRSQQDPDAIPWQFVLGIPDLTDVATGGVLLDMLGDGCSVIRGVPRGGAPRRWVVVTDQNRGVGTTLAEACARALLAEWGEA